MDVRSLVISVSISKKRKHRQQGVAPTDGETKEVDSIFESITIIPIGAINEQYGAILGRYLTNNFNASILMVVSKKFLTHVISPGEFDT